jgi:hypothetical protein
MWNLALYVLKPKNFTTECCHEKSIILIDYENVQDVNLKPLLNLDSLIKVFHNANQKFSSSFLKLAMEFGKERMELIQISGSGKNAADFHIAYFLGKLTHEIANPSFYIISKDNGFKPLVNFIKSHDKIDCVEDNKIPNIAAKESVVKEIKSDNYAIVLKHLSDPKMPKPKKERTLRNQIISICHKKISEAEADVIIRRLIAEKVIHSQNGSISYTALTNA